MFGKLFSWLGSFFKGEPESFGVYNPRQRILYRYHDGTKEVVADPLVLYREIMKDHKQIYEDLHKANDDGPSWEAAQQRLMEKLCSVFKVKRFAEGGRTDGEIISLFLHFMRYCYELHNRSKTITDANPPTGPMTEGAHEKVQPTPVTPATPVETPPANTDKSNATELPYMVPGVPPVLLKGDAPPPNKMPVIRKVGQPLPVSEKPV